MTEPIEQATEIRCPRCGELTAAGRFCSGCGAPLREVACNACGQALVAGARFCNNCGAPVGGAGVGSPATTGRPDGGVAKLIAVAALLVLVAFVAGEIAGKRSAPADVPLAAAETGGTPPAGMPLAPATDISAMSPEERASRLFNRVMLYSEQGKMDSARFFAPMAIQAYQMIGPLDAHARYDIGVIAAAVGDIPRARAEADTILVAQPNHLLGLALAARGADAAGDAAGAARFRRRLVAAASTERAKGLKEYAEHARDIDDAIKKAGAPVP